MILNIRGTGGAGKSTVVRHVMERYPDVEHVRIPNRRQPYGYLCRRADRPVPLYVVGHYETPCGGGDTLRSPAEVYQSVREHASEGDDVIFEGIISQDDVTRCVDLAKTYAVKVIALSVPIEDCLASIRARREAKGDTRPLDPTNTVNREKRLVRIVERLLEGGVDARWASRAEALALCLEALGLVPGPSTRPPKPDPQHWLDFS